MARSRFNDPTESLTLGNMRAALYGVPLITANDVAADPKRRAFAAGGRECNPRILGIGAEPGHHEQRRPRTRVPTEASGCRSTAWRSMARLVPQPGQCTSSHGMPAI